MGWFSSFLDNVLGIDPPQADPLLQQSIAAQTEATKEATAAAKASAAAALKSQKDANLIAQAASVPGVDNESVRSAADERRRKLLNGSSFGIGLPNTFGEAPTGFRVLTGQ